MTFDEPLQPVEINIKIKCLVTKGLQISFKKINSKSLG